MPKRLPGDKRQQFGHNVSFSQRRTPKTWKPNFQTKTLVIDGKKQTLKLSVHAIRTLRKKTASKPVPKPQV